MSKLEPAAGVVGGMCWGIRQQVWSQDKEVKGGSNGDTAGGGGLEGSSVALPSGMAKPPTPRSTSHGARGPCSPSKQSQEKCRQPQPCPRGHRAPGGGGLGTPGGSRDLGQQALQELLGFS